MRHTVPFEHTGAISVDMVSKALRRNMENVRTRRFMEWMDAVASRRKWGLEYSSRCMESSNSQEVVRLERA